MTFHFARGYILQIGLWVVTVSDIPNITQKELLLMVYVGIDVAKDKHDCVLVDSDGVVLSGPFTIENNRSGFAELLSVLKSCAGDLAEIKVGLEATAHYSDNLLEFFDLSWPTHHGDQSATYQSFQKKS